MTAAPPLAGPTNRSPTRLATERESTATGSGAAKCHGHPEQAGEQVRTSLREGRAPGANRAYRTCRSVPMRVEVVDRFLVEARPCSPRAEVAKGVAGHLHCPGDIRREGNHLLGARLPEDNRNLADNRNLKR